MREGDKLRDKCPQGEPGMTTALLVPSCIVLWALDPTA